MSLVRYVCTHCGRKFEDVEKDVLECPGCFWSTSVKREEDARAEIQGGPSEKSSKPSFSFAMPQLPWKPILIGLAGIAVLFILIKLAVPVMGKISERRQAAKENSSSNNESSSAKKESGKKNAVSSVKPGQPAAPADLAALSPEDQAILNRRVQINLDREVSDEEQKILTNRAVFKSGFSEKLPSQAWTMENFKEMIAQQEKFYQVPLPRSYKGKLYDLFEKKYLPGAEAFKAGNLPQARNLWVESLAFPVYANNPEKHRGVVLTMLRPFINDTLSKIGAINGASVEKGVRAKEQAVVESYEKLFSLIEKKAWPEALAAISDLNRSMAQFGNPTSLAGGPEEYPAGIAQVDRDIQYSLRGLLTVQPPALSDMEPLRMDAQRKKRVIEGLIPENVKAMQQKYDEAMDAIARGDWAASETTLKEVDLPADLYLDSQDKIQVLKKLLGRSVTGPTGPVPVKRGNA